MSQLDGLIAPAAPPPRSRLRPWLLAAGAGLLAALYLFWFLTYARLHLPPDRYDQRPPGATAMKLGAEFRLLSLVQSTQAVDQFDGPVSADADSVWVLARMEVTRRTEAKYFNCAVILVGPNGRQWEQQSQLRVSRTSEVCAPDGTAMGQTVPIEVLFIVPSEDAGQLRGIALPQNNAGRSPVITPAAS